MNDKTKARVVRELAEKVLGRQIRKDGVPVIAFDPFASMDDAMLLIDLDNDAFLLEAMCGYWLARYHTCRQTIWSEVTAKEPQEAIILAVCKARNIDTEEHDAETSR